MGKIALEDNGCLPEWYQLIKPTTIAIKLFACRTKHSAKHAEDGKDFHLFSSIAVRIISVLSDYRIDKWLKSPLKYPSFNLFSGR